MTGIQAAGVGSGLDISSLVTQLVAAERAPLDARITRRETAVKAEISALGGLKGSMSYLRDALAGLRTTSALALRSATSSAPTVFTATATSDVPPGTYDVEVVHLATAQKLTSDAFVDGRNAVVGTGTLQIACGSTSFEVAIDAQHATLASIRDAINTAPGNASVSAAIVNETGGSRLVLTARATGVANAVQVTQSGGDGGLAALVFDPAAPGSSTLTETGASDALVRINGYDYASASNSVTGAVDGLTLNLLAADAGTTHTVTITNDAAAAVTRIKKFVADYNSLAKVLGNLQAYDATTGKAGAMLGDAYVRGVQGDLRRQIVDPVSGTGSRYSTLASLGIKTDATGQLVVDDARLNAALTADFDGVAATFTSADGLASRIYASLDAALRTDAPLATRADALNREARGLTDEKSKVDARMDAVEARYRKQFTALDTLLTQMQTTSSFLARQLASSNGG